MKLKQMTTGIRRIQFPHYHRKFTAPILPLPINLILLFILILAIIINLFHSLFFGFNEEKRLKKKIISFPFVSNFHEELGAYYTGLNKDEAGNEYLLADNLFKEAKLSAESETRVLGTVIPPLETWHRLIGYNQTIEKELYYWQKIGVTFPNYTYSHLQKVFLYDKLGNTAGVKNELQNLGWEYKDIPEVTNLKNKYTFR